MRLIFLLIIATSLFGCASDSLSRLNLNSLNSLTGSTYESFDGKYIDYQTQQIRAETEVEKTAELGSLSSRMRSAADKNLIVNPYAELYLNEILEKLLAQWDQPLEKKVNIVISADRNYSALATQDTIVVTQGVLADVESEDELAFIIAHELSHILLKHQNSNEYFEKQSALVSKATNVAMAAATIKDLDSSKTANGYKIVARNSRESQEMVEKSYRIGVSINRLSRDVISSSMSRTDEDEADLLGIDLLVKAGYSPRAYKDTMERLESSLVFNKTQLEEKKKDFKSFVSMATKANKNVTGLNWETVGYMAANEAATNLLQKFADRHNSPAERKIDITAYVKREYRKERRQNLTTKSLDAALRKGKGKQVFENYWAASEAFRALEYGDIKAAEKLARKATTGVTKYDAYTRLAFYSVRERQNKQSKALQNLALIKNWDSASIQTFSLAAQAYRQQGKLDKAEEILNKGRQIIGISDPFLPQYISVYKARGSEQEVQHYLEQCKALDAENIVAQCYVAADLQIPKKSDSKIGFLESLTKMIEI
ncbi:MULTISPECIES: M48 family metalloprotease [unclassified Agarivorans]|uniref:M48 family metalloprotease n=1 Tax=unclassified Agarivorans TaxID=2636026 RepID=UPI003D7E8829